MKPLHRFPYKHLSHLAGPELHPCIINWESSKCKFVSSVSHPSKLIEPKEGVSECPIHS